MASFLAIHELEAVNLLVTVRHLIPNNSAGFGTLTNTDNAAFPTNLSSGRAVDSTLSACTRELWLLTAFGC